MRYIKEDDKECLKNASYAYWHAINVLKGPFPEGEDDIAKSIIYSYRYARDVLKGPFPKGEDAIAKDAAYSYWYARKILKAPFSKGENSISKDEIYSNVYQDLLKEYSYLYKQENKLLYIKQFCKDNLTEDDLYVNPLSISVIRRIKLKISDNTLRSLVVIILMNGIDIYTKEELSSVIDKYNKSFDNFVQR